MLNSTWKRGRVLLSGRIGLTVFALSIAAMIHAGCETEIPETDTVPPEIRLTISGPVIGARDMTNPPTRNWAAPNGTQLFDLGFDTEYSFILTVSDQGGVERAHLRMPEEFAVDSVTPSTVIEETNGIQRSLTLTGTRSNPRTALVISGTLATPEGPEFLYFEFQTDGVDFGGASGPSNQRSMSVSAAVQ